MFGITKSSLRVKLRLIALVVLVLILGVVNASARSKNQSQPAKPGATCPQSAASLTPGLPTSVIPVPRQDPVWQQRYPYNVQEASQNRETNLLFLGDSITQFMDGAHDLFQSLWSPYQPLNLGVAGDRTENVLWRILCGQELTALHPKVAVVLIGTNNLGDAHEDNSDVVAGISAVVSALHDKLPATKILLMGLLPRGTPQDHFRLQIAAINQQISALADNQHVWYIDAGGGLLQPDGTIASDIMPDLLHPSHEGYRIIFDALAPLVSELEQ